MRLTSFSIVLLLLPAALCAQEYQLSRFDMSISGTSTLHDWTSTVNDVQATAELVWEEEHLTGIETLEVKVRSGSIISGKGTIMDNKTWTALKKDEYPYITFQLRKAMVSASAPYTVTAQGNLSIAGATRAIELLAKGVPQPGGEIVFSGRYRLLMTDYGIAPPTALMGSLKTGDLITVDFEAVFTHPANSLGLGMD